MTRLYFIYILVLINRFISGEESPSGGSLEMVMSIFESVTEPAINYGVLWGRSFSGPEYNTWSHNDKIQAVVNRLCLMNAVAGGGIAASVQTSAIASLGLALPTIVGGQVMTGLTLSISLQISLVAAVAEIRGFNMTEPKTHTLMWLVLSGDLATESLKALLAHSSRTGLKRFLGSGIGGSIVKINKIFAPYLGRRFLSIAGNTAFIRLSDYVPLIGPALSFVCDGVLCKYAAKYFDFSAFEDTYLDKKTLEIYLSEGGIESGVVKAVISDGWDLTSFCDMKITELLLSKLKIGGGHSNKLIKLQAEKCSE